MNELSGQTVVITGGTGVLGKAMVYAIAGAGANIVLLSRDHARAEAVIVGLKTEPARSAAFAADVMNKQELQKAADEILARFGRIDCLINGAGGNSPKATTGPDKSFFQLDEEGIRFVTDLNLLGTILPSQVFGEIMARQKQGTILNISSMSAFSPLTRVAGYSAAKAAVSNFTQWLAVHMAQEYSPAIRVNAVAPGFFLTEQNRFLLTDKETGVLTPRGQKILDHTPMGKFGKPEDLVGAVLWLLSPSSSFVTGIVVPVDGGFSAYSGV
ncbi:MAG: SDR family oxidoreductase [Bacteroidetes bacterium]|nr:SDR family oxidoreductase [Bacteroidota bacterium]MCW5894129.1 SDR family oxidoreductase [Bacteroidota bacterium]